MGDAEKINLRESGDYASDTIADDVTGRKGQAKKSDSAARVPVAKTYKIYTAKEIEQAKLNEWNAVFEFIREKVAQLERHYAECLEFASRVKQPVLELKYEDCVEDPVAAITPILKSCNLEPEPGIEDYVRFEHHPIVGNAGPHIRVKRAARAGPAKSSGLRKEFYETSSSDIVLDEKYRMILSTNEIDFIYRHTRLAELCERLHYPTLGWSTD